MNKYDSMIACNKKASEEKVNRAVTEIRQMLTEREKVTVPKLTKRTGLSRGFFYKNETVRKEMDRALEQQAGMIDPKRYIGDIVLKNRINVLEEQIVSKAFDGTYLIRKLKQRNICLRILYGMKKCGQVTYAKQLSAALEQEGVELTL